MHIKLSQDCCLRDWREEQVGRRGQFVKISPHPIHLFFSWLTFLLSSFYISLFSFSLYPRQQLARMNAWLKMQKFMSFVETIFFPPIFGFVYLCWPLLQIEMSAHMWQEENIWLHSWQFISDFLHTISHRCKCAHTSTCLCIVRLNACTHLNCV